MDKSENRFRGLPVKIIWGMKYVFLMAFAPSYALLAAVLLLGGVVLLQMRKMRLSKFKIMKLKRKVKELERENSLLSEALSAQRAVAAMSAEPSVTVAQAEESEVASDVEVENSEAEDAAAEVSALEDSVADGSAALAQDAGEGEERLAGSDEDLLNRFVQHISDNMSDINLSIDDIASDMCMSRSNLFRKIKQITGMGPNEYMRLARLKRAAELLQERRHSIADICMLVGFNSPSYFSSCFKKQYGCLPKDYK